MRKAAFSLLMVALLMAMAIAAQAAVQLYDVKASPYVPAFIDYRLNCQSDVSIQILPSTADGTPTGAAVKTVSFTGQAKGFHRYIWLADKTDGTTAPMGYYVARLTATHNQTQWNPITGIWSVDDWTHEYSGRPLPGNSGVEGFYGIAINTNPASPYFGRIYASHKTQKDIFMYGPDGAYLGKFDDAGVPWGTSAPWCTAVADDGYVYVADRTNTCVYCFSPTGQKISQGPGTYFRGMFARTDSSGVTHLYMTGAGTGTFQVTVQPNHTTYSGLQFCYNTGGGDGWDAYGLWVSPDLTTAYAACMQGPNVGLTKWNDPDLDGTFTKDGTFNKDLVGACDGVSMYDAPGTGTDYLWVAKMVNYQNDNTTTTDVNERQRALAKVNPTTGAIIADDYDIVTWAHITSADAVGNAGVTFGKSTASWAQQYMGIFSEAGITTMEKTTSAFQLTATPAPVVVPGSAVWTADNTIAADNVDSASVSFKVMDVNGWNDIKTCTIDCRPLGYSSAEVCTLARDTTDTLSKTAIATKTGIKAKVGTRCTTSFGQPVHFLVVTPTDTTNGANTDDTELQLNVSGDPYFDANIKHRRLPDWYIDGAQIMAVGGGIPGATDPRAKGPFTYTSAPSSTTGYASLEMSAGTFQVKAVKLGFGSENPINITVPYTGYTVDLYLRPYTIAEVRSDSNVPNGTKVNVEGVCIAEPAGYNRTVTPATLNANGLAARTDTLTKRNQWYVCDANTPAAGMLCMITAPSDAFVPQWDNPAGADDFDNSTYIGARPTSGQTIMITGMVDCPGGHERRVLIQEGDINAALGKANENLDPTKIYPVYMNRGNLGGLPATPVSKTIGQIYHADTVSAKEEWGQFVQVTGAVCMGLHADGQPVGSGEAIPYFTIANAAGESCDVVLEDPTTLGMSNWTNTSVAPDQYKIYTIKGVAGRRTRYGFGCIRIRGAADLVETGTAVYPAVPAIGLADVRVAAPGAAANVQAQVTAKIGNSLWLEAADRSVGIRVTANPNYIAVNDTVQVVGNYQLQDGEMVIVPSLPIKQTATGGANIGAFDIRSREIGGNASGTTPGVATGRGALNVGLKVHFLGMVTAAGSDFYYVWDGANRSDAAVTDGSGNIGVLVEAAPPADSVPWKTTVDIVGLVSTKDLGGGNIAPTIIPSSQSIVTSYDTVHADAGTALVGSWNLMSIPVAPAAAGDGDEYSAKPWDPFQVVTPSKVPDDLDGRMYRWENCTGSLMMWDMWSEVGSHGPFGGLVLGDGYWVSLSEPWAVDYTGKNSSLDEWTGICAPGWAIVGQPKDHKTLLGDLKVHDGSSVVSMYDAVITNAWVDCIGYWWDNQTQSLVDIGIDDCFCSTNTLEPWHGYWMQFYKGDLALITPETPAAP